MKPGTLASVFLIWTALSSSSVQIAAINLDGERALQAGQRFVHGVFRGLGVVEDDSGKGARAAC